MEMDKNKTTQPVEPEPLQYEFYDISLQQLDKMQIYALSEVSRSLIYIKNFLDENNEM